MYSALSSGSIESRPDFRGRPDFYVDRLRESDFNAAAGKVEVWSFQVFIGFGPCRPASEVDNFSIDRGRFDQ
jgi:hypothetical protein